MHDARAKTVVITGGGGGIGSATAHRLAASGFSVAVLDIDRSAGAATASALVAAGHDALAVPVDIRDRAAVAAAATVVRDALGPVWGVVNNAAIERFGLFRESDPADWRDVIDVNLLGALNVTHTFLDDMVAAGDGRVVFVSSDAARVGSSGEAVYAATKGALISFAKALARETARLGVRVNVVCPGPTDTQLLAEVRRGPRGDKIMAAVERSIPLGRLAEPDDIASGIAFFLSEGAAYITGQTLSVSGGLTMAG